MPATKAPAVMPEYFRNFLLLIFDSLMLVLTSFPYQTIAAVGDARPSNRLPSPEKGFSEEVLSFSIAVRRAERRMGGCYDRACGSYKKR